MISLCRGRRKINANNSFGTAWSGEGYAETLVKLSIPHISTGDMFRRRLRETTLKRQEYMNHKLSDLVTIGIVKKLHKIVIPAVMMVFHVRYFKRRH